MEGAERPDEPLAVLAAILAGERELGDAPRALAPRVKIHFDGFSAAGTPAGWSRWVAFMRSRGRVRGLRAEVERLEANEDGTITAYGRWHGTRDGIPVASALCAPRYRVEGDRIVELWTARRHYELAFGRPALSRIGFLLIYCRFRFWAWRHGE